jgi:hypothetical protein
MQHFKEKTVADIEEDFRNDKFTFDSEEAHEQLAQKKIQEKIDFTVRKMNELHDQRQALLKKIENAKSKDTSN